MPATDRPGQVITFYSYKGGTGRSMALSNVASVLARQPNAGKGILMIDWDLEAPGLHRYFRTQLKKRLGITDDRVLDERPGLIDFFWELHAKLQPHNGVRRNLIEEDDAIALLEEIDLHRFIVETDIPGLSLLKAGCFNDAYGPQVNTFPWETFYRQAPLLLRVFAETLAEQYRCVLVDSRTGLTDISNICTMLLPEKLVVVFTPNRQSLTGIAELVQRATNYRRQSEDLRPLVVFPLASRIEPIENTLRQYWRKGTSNGDIIGYQPQFEQMFQQVYDLKDCHLDTYFNHALIPHVPSYAYGENIAVLAERRGESLVLAQRYETFAQLLVNARAPWAGAATIAVGENGQPTRREESPYRALRSFHEADKEFFFGRQEAVEQLRQRLVLREQPFLVIDGPSGSGKTSLLQAGVIPTLREERPTWDVLVVQPGADAEQDLVAAVRQWLQTHPTQDRLVLMFDQFEALLLNGRPPVRERFLAQLEQALNAALPLSVVVVLRSDLVPSLSQYIPQSFLETWWKADNMFSLPTTLQRDALNDIVREPAAAVGLVFQDGLIETIVDNAIEITPTMGERGRAAQSTVLPLLEHALHRLWEQQREGFLPHEAYQAIGALTGGLPQLAEAAFTQSSPTQFSPEDQSRARQILMQLVQVGDASLGMRDTRQRRFLADLSPSAELRDDTQQVIEKLATARLVVTAVTQDKATVEITHESLLTWPRFQQWLSEDRSFLLWKQRLRFALDEWKRTASDKEKGGLLRGALLEEAEGWLSKRSGELGTDEQRFVRESIEEQARAARRLRRLRVALVAVLLVAVAVSSLLAVMAWQNQKTKQAELQQAKAIGRYSLSLFDENQALETIVEAIRAGTILQKHKTTDPMVMGALANIRFGSSELNRLEGHDKPVESIMISPDGRTVVSGSDDGVIKLWDLKTGKAIHTLKGDEYLKSVRFSPDGHTLASSSAGKITIWNVKTGEKIRTLARFHVTEESLERLKSEKIPDDVLENLKGILDQDYRTEETFLHILEETIGVEQTGQYKSLILEYAEPRTGCDFIYSLSFSPDGQTLASGCAGGTITLSNVETGENIRTIKGHFSDGHGSHVTSVSFSSDGQRVASGSQDGTAKLWDVKGGEEPLTLKGHKRYVNSVSFSPDGQTVASGSHGGIIKLWEVKTGKEIRTLQQEANDYVNSLSFSPDGKTLASGSGNGVITFWNLETGENIRTLNKGQKSVVNSLSFSPDGQTLASSSDDGIKLWKVMTDQAISTFTGENDITIFEISPDGQTVASGDREGSITLWNRETGKPIDTFTKEHDEFDRVSSLRFSPDGQTLASGHSKARITLWNPATREKKLTLDGQAVMLNESVNTLSFSPDGKMLASSSGYWDLDRTIKLWNLETGKEIRTLKGHQDIVTSVSFSPDGQTVASGSVDKTIKLWKVGTGENIRTLEGHDKAVTSVSFSPDSQTVASGSVDKTIKLWKVETGENIRTLNGHQGIVTSVSFSPNGRMVASSSQDKTNTLWNVETGQAILTLTGYDIPAIRVSFSPDGQMVASGSQDKTIKLWNLPDLKPYFELDHLVWRNCDWVRGYLENNPNVSQEDKALCDQDSP